MKHRAVMGALCALVACALAGCQLARLDAGPGAGARTDRFIGVLVTTEYLDLFDIDGYLEDNIGNFSGGDFVVDGNAPEYQGRLYAKRVTRTLTNEETGEAVETDEYVFDGVEGIPFFTATVRAADGGAAAARIPSEVPDPGSEEADFPMDGMFDMLEAAPWAAGDDSYTTTASDPAISDVHTAIHYGDTERRTALTGTVYIAPIGGERTLYFNPVYQDADGNVYVTSDGGGYMIGDWTLSEGEQYAQTMDGTQTVTENGVTYTDSVSVTLKVSVLFAPGKVAVVQMDADSVRLSRAEYAPGALPEAITPEPGAAYLVVETHKRDATGGAVVTRAVYGQGDDVMSTFAVRDDGICVKRDTRIAWPGAKNRREN